MKTNQKKLLAQRFPSSYTQLKRYGFKLASKIYQEGFYIVSLKVDNQKVFYAAMGNITRQTRLPVFPLASNNINDMAEFIAEMTFEVLEAKRKGQSDSLLRRLREDFMPTSWFTKVKTNDPEPETGDKFRIKTVQGPDEKIIYVIYNNVGSVIEINTTGAIPTE